MWRDIVFCIIIIIVIVALDFFIQDYIKNSAEEMTSKLDNLKSLIYFNHIRCYSNIYILSFLIFLKFMYIIYELVKNKYKINC